MSERHPALVGGGGTTGANPFGRALHAAAVAGPGAAAPTAADAGTPTRGPGVVAMRRGLVDAFALAGRDVAEVFAAVGTRIEVSGAGPYKISAPSVEAAVEYAERRFERASVVTARSRRGVFGPRVQVTISTADPADPADPEPADDRPVTPPVPAPEPRHASKEVMSRKRRTSTVRKSGRHPSPSRSPRPAPARPEAVDLLVAQLDDDPATRDALTLAPTRPEPAPRPEPGAFSAVMESYRAAVNFEDVADDELVAPPVLPAALRARVADLRSRPTPPDNGGTAAVSSVARVRLELSGLGVSSRVWDALDALDCEPGQSWQQQVSALVADRLDAPPAPAEDERGGVAVIGYGPAGAAAVLTALVDGVEVAGLRKDRAARLLPVTPTRLVRMLEQGLDPAGTT